MINELKRLTKEIEEIEEILESLNKTLLTDKIILELELNKKQHLLENLYIKYNKKKNMSNNFCKQNKGKKRRKNIIKDKQKHGRHYITNRRNYAKQVSDNKVRNHIDFIPKGASYRKIFEYDYTVW